MANRRDVFLHRNFYFHRVWQFLLVVFAIFLSVVFIALEPSELAALIIIPSLIVACIFLLVRSEVRYANKQGFTFFPPGWGTLRPDVVGGVGRFLSLWELLGTLRWRKGGILVGRPLPEHTLFGLFGWVRVGPIDDRHFLTIAGSRAGKGTAAIIPNLATYPGSAIVIDPKGELATTTAYRRGLDSNGKVKNLGQKVFIFDPEAIVEGIVGSCWNPLDELDLQRSDLWDQIEKIALSIVEESSQQADGNTQFFNTHARGYLMALIGHVLMTEPQEKRHLIYVRQLIMEGDQELFDTCAASGNKFANPVEALLHFMASSLAFNGKIARIAKSLCMEPHETRAGIESTLRHHTAFLDNSGLEASLQYSDFSLRSLKLEPTTIYLCLKATSLGGSLAKILRIFIDLSIVVLEGISKQQEHSVLFILDEFYVLGRIESIDKAIGLVAGFGVTLWPVLQHMGQLKKHYPDTWDNFLRNCRGVQLFGELDPETLTWVEQRMGYRLQELADGRVEKVPLKTSQELAADFLLRESRRQIYVPTGRPVALLELLDYYRFFPRRWFLETSAGHRVKHSNSNAAHNTQHNSQANTQYNTHAFNAFKLVLDDGRQFLLKAQTVLTSSDIPELAQHVNPRSGTQDLILEVNQHPQEKSILGIMNMSHLSWQVKIPDRPVFNLQSGQTVKVISGTSIFIGSVAAHVH